MNIKKIVITGPESTGKSTLCRQLAQHYGCYWVPEYARKYLEVHGPEYEFADLLTIAKGQIAEEERWLQRSAEEKLPYLFIDTCMYVMKVWSEFVYNDCNNQILNEIATRHYDAFLLCNIDMPWVFDELREHPTERARIFRYYADALQNQHVPWMVVEGGLNERLSKAINFIDRLPTNK